MMRRSAGVMAIYALAACATPKPKADSTALAFTSVDTVKADTIGLAKSVASDTGVRAKTTHTSRKTSATSKAVVKPNPPRDSVIRIPLKSFPSISDTAKKKPPL